MQFLILSSVGSQIRHNLERTSAARGIRNNGNIRRDGFNLVYVTIWSKIF